MKSTDNKLLKQQIAAIVACILAILAAIGSLIYYTVCQIEDRKVIKIVETAPPETELIDPSEWFVTDTTESFEETTPLNTTASRDEEGGCQYEQEE